MESTGRFDSINGTLIWYYYICKREVWLMSRQLNPDQRDENIEWGRFMHELRYARERKELAFDNVKVDIAGERNGKLLIAEIKKTSSFRKSAAMQLLFYLWQLKESGVEAAGELRFPEEKRRETVILDGTAIAELQNTVKDIQRIIAQPKPPKPEKIKYCGKCAYREFCWA